MFTWFNTMSTFEQLSVLAFTVGTLIGAVWWMGKMFFTVNAIQTNTRNTNTKIDTLTTKMDGELHDVRSVQREQQKEIGDLQIRMVRVEGAIDTEAE